MHYVQRTYYLSQRIGVKIRSLVILHVLQLGYYRMQYILIWNEMKINRFCILGSLKIDGTKKYIRMVPNKLLSHSNNTYVHM